MVPEAPIQQTEHGLYAGGEGWFVLNMYDVRWWYRGHGFEAGLSGFLLLADEALLIIEGKERLLKQWDFVHSGSVACRRVRWPA